MEQWVIVDTKVFDLSKFAAMHPGGLSVLLDEEVGAEAGFFVKVYAWPELVL